MYFSCQRYLPLRLIIFVLVHLPTDSLHLLFTGHHCNLVHLRVTHLKGTLKYYVTL